jgi:hypothetical protein
MEKRIKQYFDTHKDIDVFYFTSDGLAFTDKDVAKEHQRSVNGNNSIKGLTTERREKDKKSSSSDKDLVKLQEELQAEQAKCLDLDGEELEQQKAVVEELQKKLLSYK